MIGAIPGDDASTGHASARAKNRVAGQVIAGDWDSGSPSRTRTCDKAINSRLLYQLSYRGSRPRLYTPGSRDASASSRTPADATHWVGHDRERRDAGGGPPVAVSIATALTVARFDPSGFGVPGSSERHGSSLRERPRRADRRTPATPMPTRRCLHTEEPDILPDLIAVQCDGLRREIAAARAGRPVIGTRIATDAAGASVRRDQSRRPADREHRRGQTKLPSSTDTRFGAFKYSKVKIFCRRHNRIKVGDMFGFCRLHSGELRRTVI